MAQARDDVYTVYRVEKHDNNRYFAYHCRAAKYYIRAGRLQACLYGYSK